MPDDDKQEEQDDQADKQVKNRVISHKLKQAHQEI